MISVSHPFKGEVSGFKASFSFIPLSKANFLPCQSIVMLIIPSAWANPKLSSPKR
jgi:hypothetical protein